MSSIREKLQIVKNELDEKQARVAELEHTVKSLSKQITDLTSDYDNLLSYKTTTEPAFTANKARLKEVEEQVRLMELTRFAQAYKDQETEYREEQNKWFWYVIIASIFLTGSIMFSIFVPIYIPMNGRWFQEPGFYLLDAMFLTLFIYSLKRYSHLGNLIVDYANRKTLAQSYQHLVESDDESVELRNKFQERVVEIITAQPLVQDDKVTIYEHFLDQITNKLSGILK